MNVGYVFKIIIVGREVSFSLEGFDKVIASAFHQLLQSLVECLGLARKPTARGLDKQVDTKPGMTMAVVAKMQPSPVVVFLRHDIQSHPHMP